MKSALLLTLIVYLVGSGLPAAAQDRLDEPASRPIARVLTREAVRLAAQPNEPADRNWSRVRKLEPDTEVIVIARGSQPGRRYFPVADEDDLTVLNLTDLTLPTAARGPANSGGRAGDDQAQHATVPSADAYVPISGAQRVDWIVDGTVGPRSLGVGVLAASWQTGFNAPQEWGQTWSGFGKRYIEREADVAISNTIEAGLGALWGEDPRYILSGRHGVWPRARYALKTVFLAQRSNGHLAPAWGRYAGNVFNNVIENAWLPPSATTWGQTTVRSANGFLGRAAGNLWEEFWPDVRKRFKQ